MNAPSALDSFSWTTGSLLSLTQNSAAGGTDSQATDGQSFQSLLAQATASDAGPNNGGDAAADGSAGSLEAANNSTTSTSPSISEHDRSAVVGSWPKATEHAGAKTTSRPANARSGRLEVENRAAALPSAADSAANAASNDTSADPAAQPSLVSALGSKNPKAPSTGNSTVTALPGSAVNALGGVKGLSGVAFAMHITPASGTAGQTNSSPALAQAPVLDATSLAADLTSAPAGVQPGALAGTLSGSAENAAATLLPAIPDSSTANPLPTNSGAAASTPAYTAGVAEVGETEAVEEPSGAPQTVRTVQVQLTGEGEGRVDLRMVEHSGGLSVSVRASDGSLTKNLQDNLADLNSRLTEAKYQTQSFIPSASEVSGSSTSNSSNGSSSHGESQNGNQADRQSGMQGNANGDNSGGSGSRSGQGQQARDDAAGWRQLAALAKLSSSAVQNNS